LDPEILYNSLNKLKNDIQGDVYFDEANRLLYATDASAYREVPLAVIRPVSNDDIKKIILFAGKNETPLIPRAAGTSLAGQVVGGGIVVDISRYMTEIIEVNEKEKWVRVQPGVVLDELNKYLEPTGLFFGPETSTSNRCMIGGMVGNNACGAHSILYGNTRNHLISVKAFLSDGSEVEIGPLGTNEFEKKCKGETLENKIYKNIKEILSDISNQEEIHKEFPDKNIYRRNTGYAIDLLLETDPFTGNGEPFNFCKIIAGSEGTLAFITEIKLNLVPLPPKIKGLICAHYNTINEALKANLIALKHKPGSVELMDKIILDCSKNNIDQQKNRFFIQGDPEAILIIEFARDTREEIEKIKEKLEKDMKAAGLGYHYPLLFGDDINKVWALRKASLGTLSNIPGDKKPVAVIEDTAVNVNVLPDYIDEFQKILEKFGLNCVYYAHVGSGELHLRPVLNLKDQKDVNIFHAIAYEVALLVKKYNGSLSGEHGDGRLRGEFIPVIIGDKNYNLLKIIKKAWDPSNIFNPGKITDTPVMNTSLRYKPDRMLKPITTYFDFSKTFGIRRAVEQCNGSADCRKSSVIGGTMCPSYMATKDENKSTRARANILREYLTNSTKQNPFNHKEIYSVMDLCLSCKGCKAECPSNVDITKLKAEFLQHYYKSNNIPLRTRLIANINKVNKLGSIAPAVFNFLAGNNITSKLLKQILNFAPKRKIPHLGNITLKKWARRNLFRFNPVEPKNGKVCIFADEFTNYNDLETGIKTIKLLTKLGYSVEIASHIESGRAYLSKGFVKKAKKIACKNVDLLKHQITQDTPLIGIEPSALLTIRDEYTELVSGAQQEASLQLAANSFLIEEFIAAEIDKGKIIETMFSKEKKTIKLHGHCHQKALVSTTPSIKMLSIPENYTVEEIKSGCCGMAGSFGYENEHYELSMKIGEMILFPAIRDASQDTIIAAPGTSCRQQIKDGTGRDAFHPVEILYDALIENQSAIGSLQLAKK